MKDKILVFIIGLLIGAILATGGFLIYEKNSTSNTQIQSQDGGKMQPPDGNSMGEPPAKPDGDSNTMQEPPAKPAENNQQAGNSINNTINTNNTTNQ